MTVEVTQNLKKIDITVTQNGDTIKIQPIINTSSSGSFDGIVNGGTL